MSEDDDSTGRGMTQLDDLRNTLSQFNREISNLRVTLAEATTTLRESTARAIEDRLQAKLIDTRVGVLEGFKSRVQGQLAVLAFVVGVLGTVGTLWAAGVHF